MTRKAGMLAPVFAVAAIVMVNCPVRLVAQEAVQRISTSDDVLTLELSAAQSCKGTTCHTAKRRTATAHKPTRVSTRSHKTAKAGTRTHKVGSTSSHKSANGGNAKGTHVGTGTTKLGTGPGKMGSGPGKKDSGSAKIGTGPGKLGLQSNTDKNAAASSKTGVYFNKGMDPQTADKPDKPETTDKSDKKPEKIKTTVIIGPSPPDFPGWKKGNPLPPGWTTQTIETEDEIQVISIPPNGWKSKNDTRPTATQADLDRFHTKVAECEAPYRKEAAEYWNMLQKLRASRAEAKRNKDDTADVDAQITDVESMWKLKSDEATNCWPSLFKIWTASGYKNP